METAARAAAAAAAGAIMALVVRKHNPELSLLTGAATAIFVLLLAMPSAGELIALIGDLREQSGMSSAVFTPMLKCVAIGIVSKFGSDICRDASQQSAASAVELLGSVCALCTAVPLFRTFIRMIGGM